MLAITALTKCLSATMTKANLGLKAPKTTGLKTFLLKAKQINFVAKTLNLNNLVANQN
jgi:hypothetical protein